MFRRSLQLEKVDSKWILSGSIASPTESHQNNQPTVGDLSENQFLILKRYTNTFYRNWNRRVQKQNFLC